MTGGPSLELDSRQVLQLHSALVGAFSAVLYFLRRVDEDRTIQVGIKGPDKHIFSVKL